jgi:hypothetical protein
MTFVFGVLGALSMIASVAFGTVLAIAEGYDKRHAPEAPERSFSSYACSRAPFVPFRSSRL